MLSRHLLWKFIKAKSTSFISVSAIEKCPNKFLESLEGLKGLFDFKFQVIDLFLEEVKAEAYWFSSIVKNRKNKHLGSCLIALS